ncbi:MAG: ABC transporter permease, partial [Actinomycetota bacterium]|nr:ABC transporter permease [Actinomycetota bacterium]
MITWVYVLWSLLPILVAVRISLNDGRSRSSFQPMSFRWYWGDPTASLWHDDSMHTALFNTLRLAALTMLVATPIGVAMALGLQRWRGKTSNAANGLMLVPIVTPEIVFGVALFLVFSQLYTGVPDGITRQLLGHVTFTISFVVVIIRSRLAAIGTQYEEAARDLGASRLQAIRLVLLPLLAPAIFASVMVVFATSVDDFVISSFLSTGESTETVPIKIYAGSRASSTP